MPYITGQAATLGDLVTALQNACTTNGWTLSGEVLHKDGVYVRVAAVAANANDWGFVLVSSGLGIDGSNNLTTPTDQGVASAHGKGIIGPNSADWDWPVTYHIHVLEDPDEVFMMVNYDAGQYWQGLSFGRSPAPGCPGTGNWHHASSILANAQNSTSKRTRPAEDYVCNPGGSVLSSFQGGVNPGMVPFWQYTKDESNNRPTPSQFHGVWANDGVSVGWSSNRYNWNSSGNPGTSMSVCSSSRVCQPLPTYSPNTWNDEAHLFRLQILCPRLEWKSSIVGEIMHARFVRNDFLSDGEVITLGGDKWKVYPAYRKNAAARNGPGTSGSTHSGTCAIAVRYDGA